MSDPIQDIRRAIRCNHSRAESRLLWECAQKTDGLGDILEIGSEHGGSGAILASAMRPGRKLIAIDLWEGDQAHTSASVASAVQNWRAAGVLSRIVVIKARSPQAPIAPLNPIGFLWIDGDHSAKGVRQDFERWQEYVPEGGLIGFHDYDCPSGPGVKEFVDGIAALPGFVEFARVDNMVVLRKENRRGD